MAHNYEAIGRAAVSGLYLKISIPKGYEAVDFRQPGKGETILGAMAGDCTHTLVTDGANFDERLILRKVESKMVGWTLRLSGRAPVTGELYVYGDKDSNNIRKAYGNFYEYHYPQSEALDVTPIYEDQE